MVQKSVTLSALKVLSWSVRWMAQWMKGKSLVIVLRCKLEQLKLEQPMEGMLWVHSSEYLSWKKRVLWKVRIWMA